MPSSFTYYAEIGCANPMVDENCNMNFKQINNTNERMKDF
jgi:hypothetical protein